MQQTSKYQFNLVDTTDDFSPAPLNQNMEKVEEELSGLSTALTQGLGEVEDSVSALEDSVDTQLAAVMANLGTAGKTARIAWGTYLGDDNCGPEHPSTLTCDFYPVLVLIQGHSTGGTGNASTAVLLRGATYGGRTHEYQGRVRMTWTDTSVSWYSEGNDEWDQLNFSGGIFAYLIVGYDKG